MPPKKKPRTDDEAADQGRWYAVDLKKKAKQINMPAPPGHAKTLTEALATAGGELDPQHPPIFLSAADKGLEARIVTLAEMQTHGAPGWWQVSSQYASPEDAAKKVLIQQARLGDVQGKRPWRLLVREMEGSGLESELSDPAKQNWLLTDLVRSSAALVAQAQMGDAEMKPAQDEPAQEEAIEAQKLEATKEGAAQDLAAATNGQKEEPSADGEAKQADGEAAQEEEASSKELEVDAPEDSREKLKDPVAFLTPDTTLNVMQSRVGNMLMTLNEGGLQYLLAAARASVGLKSGRYMFEARIVENVNHFESQGNQSRSAVPRNLLRVGVCLGNGIPILGDNEDSVGFDSEGNLVFNRKRTNVAHRFTADNTIAVVLNLSDEDSPNASTISLFKDGERACDPQPLPENLRGKVLYPCVTFKNVSLHVHFGPYAHHPLPFRCRTVQEASVDDVVVTSYPAPKDGKHQVVFPVMLPDEGTFDWVDWFLQRNPHYTELSERMIVDWAMRSGLWRPKSTSYKSSLDRPDMNFGIQHLDDGTVKQMLHMAATVQQRSLIVLEVRGNLLKQERAEALERFKLPYFRKIARVMMGEPGDDYKEYIHSCKLAEKQAKSDMEFKIKKQEKARKKLMEIRQKQVEKARKKAEKQVRRENERKRKLEEAAQKAAEAGEEATKTEEDKAAPEAEEAKEEEEEEEDEIMEVIPKEEAEDPPKVALTEAEKRDWFAKKPGSLADVAAFTLGQSYAKFSLPEKDDGFDEVEYAWQQHDGCLEHIRRWNLDRKVATRVDDLQPSEWFREKWQEWQRDLSVWHKMSQDFKDPSKRTAMIQAGVQARVEQEAAIKAWKELQGKSAEQMEEVKEEKTEDAKEGKEASKTGDAESKPPADTKTGDTKKEDTKKEAVKKEDAKEKDAKKEDVKKDDGKKEDVKKEDGEKEKASGQEETKDKDKDENKDSNGEADKKPDEEEDPVKALVEELRSQEVDLFGLLDITDDTTGEPLYVSFAFEDWALLSLRFELHLLCHAFRRDCNDLDRTGIHPDHIAFYYNKYYKKGLNPKNYGVESIEDLVKMIRDTVVVCMKVIESQVSDDLENNEVFVKLTEESRRERQRRLDSGDESAKLHFTLRAPDPSSMNVVFGAGRTGIRPSAVQAQQQQPPAMQPPSEPPQQVIMPVQPGIVQRPPVRLSMPPSSVGGKGFMGKGPPQQQWGSQQSWYSPRSVWGSGSMKGSPGPMGSPRPMMSRSGPYQGGWRYR